MPPKINASFVFKGRFNPDEVTAELGLTPTSIHRVGEPRVKHIPESAPWEFDGWAMSTEYVRSYDLDVEILKVLHIVRPHAKKIRELCARMSLEAIISCAVNLNVIEKDGDVTIETPSICLTHEVLELVRELNADLDIDII